ncbi:MAG: polysaccharide deacetylase family protein [Ferruginibacter sp.]
MYYLVKTPWWLKKIYNKLVWDADPAGKKLYLSFDDGPHPQITPFVLNELKKFNAKATFFCIGQNVEQYPGIYRQIIDEGHSVGNHTYNHLNGWKTDDAVYLENVARAQLFIDSNLFRPPYGKITGFQRRQLAAPRFGLHTIMWSVVSGDFDAGISPERCLNNVLRNSREGSVVVFHDSEKARDRLEYALPKALEYFAAKGFSFEKIVISA